MRGSDILPEKKRDILDALFTFIKADQARTFTAHEFSQNYLPLNLRDPYKQHLDSKKFPDRAIVRDTSAMGARLRRRKYKFGDDAELVASPEAISSGRVTIKTDSAGRLGGEGDEQWTQITIQHQMTDQR